MDKQIKVTLHEPPQTSGLVGFISWQSIERLLKKTNRLKPDEVISNMQITQEGINYFIRT